MMTFPSPPEWTADAICAQVDYDIWFPEKGGSTRAAKTICRSCPVVTECLEAALAADANPAGIWGATSWKQRQSMRGAA